MHARVGLVALVAALAAPPAAFAMHLGKDAPAGSAGAAAVDSVLVVGDSLEVGTGPYLERELAGVEVTVEAETGRPSSAAVGVLEAELGAEHDVVVFDLGTNDDPAAPAALAASLDAARRLASGRCLVVATLNRPPLNGVPVDGLNDAVRSFASSAPEVQLVDWQHAAQSRPGMLTDGVHATGAGYAYRAGLIADGVRSCAATGEPAAATAPSGSGPPPPKEPRPRNPKVLSDSDLAAAAAYEIALTIASGIQEGAGA